MLKDLTGGRLLVAENAPSADVAGQPLLMLRQIAHLCTSAFADYCAIYLRAAGSLPAAVSSRVDGTDDLEQLPYTDSLKDEFRSAGFRTMFVEPLNLNGHHVGSLVLGMRGGGEDLTDIDRQVLATLSTILTTVVEQARQLAHHYRVSNRLQRALLPATLASAPDTSFNAAYRPADDEAEVGGDWYDAFDVRDGTIGFSIGDVTGHGLEAAVAMSEIRRVIRSAAIGNNSPSEILNEVDDVVSSEGIGMATALVGIYEVETGILRYASTGHPGPVLMLREGRPVALPAGGMLLGLGMKPASPDWVVSLPAGAALYLFTDGLLEYSRDIVAGERTLLRALEQLRSNGTVPSAHALHDHIFAEVLNTDDAATLVLERHASATPDVTLRYSSVPQFAALARDALRAFGAQYFGEDRLFEFLAATGEAVANGIEHGSREPDATFEIIACERGGDIIVEVTSHGHWRIFTPREERGRGVPIMRACARAVEISSMHDRTTVRLMFRR